MRRIAALAAGLALAAALAALTACGAGTTDGQGSPAPSAGAASPPAASPPAKGVSLRYGGNAQVELVAPGGRVLIDVWDPSALSAPPAAGDVLLTSHDHDDHLVAEFVQSFPGKQLYIEAGKLSGAGAEIVSIPAAHSQGEPLRPRGGSDYIFVIEMGGLRIAHFGDIGQDALTPAQLRALGDVDVAITQFDNSFSQMDLENKKGFALMEQVKPRLIVPTHSSTRAVDYAANLWPVLWSDSPAVTITRARLPGETSLLVLGADAQYQVRNVEAGKVDW